MKNVPRVLLITDHLAPYNLPALSRVYARGHVSLEVAVVFERIAKHDYWPEMKAPFAVRAFSGTDTEPGGHSAWHWRVVEWMRKGRYDVVCVSGYREPTHAIALTYCILMGTPFVWIIDSILATPRSTLTKALKWLPIKAIANLMGAAWVPGAASVDYLKAYGAPRDKLFQGCYCLDAVQLAREASILEAKKMEVRASLGLSQEVFVFLFVGRMIPERGLPFLAKAFDRLQESRPETALVLVGKGPERAALEAFFRDQGTQNVTMYDPVPIEKLTKYFVASDCYVHSSTAETYSLTTAHASIVGRPLIVTKQVGACADYLIEGETGYGAEAADAESLRSAMKRMRDTPPEIRAEMGRQAKAIGIARNLEWAAEQFDEAVFRALRD